MKETITYSDCLVILQKVIHRRIFEACQLMFPDEHPCLSAPGACFLLEGPSGIGKTHLTHSFSKSLQKESFFEPLSKELKERGIIVELRHVNANRAISVLYSDNTTNLHCELFGNESLVSSTLVKDGTAGSLIVNYVIWDHIETFFSHAAKAEDCIPQCFVPELLTHFGSLTTVLSGRSLGQWQLEPRSIDKCTKEPARITITILLGLLTSPAHCSGLSMIPWEHWFALAAPTEGERRAILTSHDTSPSFVDTLAARTGGRLAEYVAALGRYSKHFSDPDSAFISFDAEWRQFSLNHRGLACPLGGGASSSGYIDVQKTLWDDIAGLGEAKARLQGMFARPLAAAERFARYGILPSVGVVLYGPPGTGKTMLAKAVATELCASFVYLDLPSLVQGAVGQSEAVLREFFSVARQRAPCVVFIDELQAAFGRRYDEQRGGNNSAHDARLVAALLSELDLVGASFFQAPVVFIGATNHIDLIDAALLRPGRLDAHVYVGPPDDEARHSLIKQFVDQRWKHWPPVAMASDITKMRLIHYFCERLRGKTGAEIKNEMNKFALDYVIEDRDMSFFESLA